MLQRINHALKRTNWGLLGAAAYLVVLLSLIVLLFTTLAVRPIVAGALCVLVALPLALLVHELGHWVAGTVLGLRFQSIGVGPLTWSANSANKASPPRLRFSWATPHGHCAFALPALPNLRDHLLVYVLGGSLASSLFVLFAVIETALFGSAIWAGMLTLSPVWWLVGVLAMAGWLSLPRLLVSLYPAHWLNTDGHTLLELLRSRTHAYRLLATVRLRQQISDGVRPREWDAALTDDLVALHDRSPEALSAHHLAYRWALDRGDAPAAEKYLARAIEVRRHAFPRERATLMVEAAYLEMRLRANRASAQAWLRKTRGEMQRAEQFPKWRLLCAVEVALGQTSVARSVAKRALRALEESTDGLAIAEREMFQELLDQCDQPLTRSPALGRSAEVAMPVSQAAVAITADEGIATTIVPASTGTLPHPSGLPAVQ
jgi:hypothetical protein